MGFILLLVWLGVLGGEVGFFSLNSEGKSFQGKFLVVGRHMIINVLLSPV